MNDDEIKAIAAQLESAARVEDAKFRLDAEWNENNSFDHCLVANRAAFLRLSALLLRGAVAEENVISAALPKFENEFIEPLFQKLERRELWIKAPPVDTTENWFSKNIGELVLGIVLILIVIGLFTIMKWIFGAV
ncbi:hypothetical protein B1R32_10454 [Abditibacterium utsteinense]|uniref:Uncharacterized protein n=2 Tax=Abditibacterium utsteinense TaxID=1960156 RepID=A0A2S8SUU9_9BACT|nr:hypothetical protein B1R32_10454 [Abditibacterium utsteinense]